MFYYKTLYSSDFIDNGDGTHTATILESTHGMGMNYNCVRALRRNDDNSYSSVLNNFTIAANGDFLLTVNEPTIFKVGLESIPE